MLSFLNTPGLKALVVIPLLCVSLFYNPIWNFDWAIQFYPIIFQAVILLTFLVTLLLSRKTLFLLRINIIDVLVAAYYLYAIFISIWRNGNLEYDADIFTLIAYLLTYFTVRLLISSNSDRVNLFRVLLAFAIFNCAIGFLQIMGVLGIASESYTLTGTFNNPGPFGGYMAMMVPIAAYFVFTSKAINLKILNASIFCLLITATFLSSSRAALLAVLISLFVILYTMFKDKIKRYHKTAIIGTLLLCAVVLLFLYQVRPASADGRLLIWNVSATMITPSTILGNGIGYFNDHYNLFQAQYFSSGQGSLNEKLLAGYVHSPFNEFIGVFIEFGIPGILLFLGIFFIAIKMVFTKKIELVTIIPIASVISFLIFAQFSYPLQLTPLHALFCIFLGSMASNNSIPFKSINLGKFSKPCLVIMTLLSSVLLCCIYNSFRSVAQWRSANIAINYNLAYALDTYEKIRPKMRNSYTFLYNYGSELANLGYYKKALEVYKELNGFHHNIHLYSQMGRCYEEMKLYDQAESFYRIASNMEPIKLSPQMLLFELFKASGQHDKSIIQAKAILNTPVKIQTAAAERIRNEMRLYLLNQPENER